MQHHKIRTENKGTPHPVPSHPSNTIDNISLEQNAIVLSPNPQRDIFTITGSTEQYNIEIIDAAGIARIQLSTEQPDPIEVNINNLPSGASFIRIHNKNKKSLWLERLIKL